MAVRSALHAAGLRFRLHRRDLPGSPDVVLPGRRLVVLVHGCFWHQHAGCALARRPRVNAGYWLPKLARNIARDARVQGELAALGWRVLVVWECEARDPARLAAIVSQLLRSERWPAPFRPPVPAKDRRRGAGSRG